MQDKIYRIIIGAMFVLILLLFGMINKLSNDVKSCEYVDGLQTTSIIYLNKTDSLIMQRLDNYIKFNENIMLTKFVQDIIKQNEVFDDRAGSKN